MPPISHRERNHQEIPFQKWFN